MLRKPGWKTTYSRLTVLCSCVLGLSLSSARVDAQSLASGDGASAGEPEFVLVGTSRFGNRYSATLQFRSGRQVLVASENGAAVPLPGLHGYSEAIIESRRVLIRHSSDTSCTAYPLHGVVCDAQGATVLELKVRGLVAIAAPDSGLTVIRSANDLTDVPAEPGSFIDRIQTEAAAKGVKPEVPNGLRLIETSTGFQLVPED